MSRKLFSVVVVHYQQKQYLEKALRCVLQQDYPAIELLIADDATEEFPHGEIQRYVEENRGENLLRFEIVAGARNVGTVGNLNNALAHAKGDYILCFAADDCLSHAGVLSQFASRLEQLPEDGLCVSAQCVMMDEELEHPLREYTDSSLAAQLNGRSAQEQFLALQEEPRYALGASAFCRQTLLRDPPPFDPAYRLVEDWPFFLSRTRMGKKVYYEDFPALRHRAGGVSDNLHRNAQNQRRFKADILRIWEREILPFLDRQPLARQEALMARYEAERAMYDQGPDVWRGPSAWQLAWAHKKLFLRRWVFRRQAAWGARFAAHAKSLLLVWCAWLFTGAFGMQFCEQMNRMGNMGACKILVAAFAKWILPFAAAVCALNCLLDCAAAAAVAIRRCLNFRKGMNEK